MPRKLEVDRRTSHHRRSGTVIALIAVVAGGFVGTQAAKAAATTIDANTFATSADYCGNGQYVQTVRKLKVSGGSGAFPTGGCDITLSGASLSFTDTELSGTDNFVVTGGGAEAAALKFKRAEIRMDNVIDIQPGHDGARVKVVKSTLTGFGTYISAYGEAAKVSVNKSSLEATYNGSLVKVETASKGRVKVSKSTLTTDEGNILIVSGANGRTKAIANQLTSKAVTIQSDGACASERNDPETPCS